MNLEKYTEKAQEAIVNAQQWAIRLDQQQVDGGASCPGAG